MSPSSDSLAPSIPGLDLVEAMARMDLSWEEMKELLAAFPASAREEVAKLRATPPGNAAALRFSAHTLAGLAGNYGAKELSAAAKALETVAIEGRLAEAPALAAKVEALADRVCCGVEKVLGA